MKRILSIISLLLFCTFEMVQSQSVFPTKNARWEVLVPAPYYEPHARAEGAPFLKGNENGHKAMIYTIGEDSIIGVNDKVYYNLYIDNLYAGSLRVDEKKVWITADEGSHETLLYDFGVKEGDTVTHRNLSYLRETPFYKEHPLIVYRDSGVHLWYDPEFSRWEDEFEVIIIKVNEGDYGKEVTAFHRFGNDDTWCESLGSLHGIFLTTAMTSNGVIAAGGGCLWKLFKDEELIYPDKDFGPIEEQLTDGDLDVTLTSIPSEDFLYDNEFRILQLKDAGEGIKYTLKVSYLSGYDVFETELSSSKPVVDLSSLPLGWYVCTLIKQGQVIAIKKINR